ncbi:universal stress protein [Proteus mirabilis]|uniref:universal stress protein n=1 Tax=Proteus TaxID=583 RepID=UPI0005059629|nr:MULTISPECIES: universal stress protein [Proteus]AUT91284.1 universal stress protein [Proteus mirabilis]EKW0399965.1 universal stress protein [Proteus mirabilis]EKW0543031.1 universal stress protein [Proteus mirabilis]EKW4511817.1 universal stress protein [Proteus mirabilis]EKW4850740.1 universal stress protein [Proteus mirabilis]
MAKTILVAIDLLEDDRIHRMVKDIQFLARKADHYFHFVTVMPNLRSLEAYGLDCDSPSVIEKKHQAVILLTEKLAHCVQQQFQLPKEQYQCHALIGTPNYNILELANEMDVDTIVIGSSSRNRHNILLGSTADYIVNNTNCSVLVIR